MVGMVLGNRYELIEEVGSGGMALVYKAKCSMLNRNVAVKVLKPEFSNDEEFLKRFRIEAQAAASLQHPNIVSIFDVGQEDDIYYIVMEYVDGITLKEYIKEKGPLDWKETAEIGLRICSAIKKAHHNNIIHRDIKPQNILMTSDGIPKVTDFGIARAATCATMTMKTDTVGSVHYSSPEQARGGYTDEKSDIYSIGVTIFEMLTGKPPFNADTAVTVALKHIQDMPPEPIEIRPDIPIGMNSIILRAMQKSKADRYQNTAEMMSDLERVLTDPRVNITIPEPVSGDDEDMNQTRKMKAVEGITVGAGKKKTTSKKGKPDEKKNKGADFVLKALTTVLVVFIIGMLIYIGYNKWEHNRPLANPEYVVENLVGQDFESVKTKLEAMNIKIAEPEYIYDENSENGIILEQNPEAGIKIKVGGFTSLEFKVSKGKNMVTIPDIKYKEYIVAEILLRDDYGLKPMQKTIFDEFVGIGQVIKTEPEMGTSVEAGSEIIVYKSMGPEITSVLVPELIGMTMEEAKTALFNSHLKVGYIYPEDTEGHKGVIYDQAPKPGDETTEDTPVTLYFKDKDDNLSGDGGSTISLPGSTEFVTYIAKLNSDYGDVVQLKITGIPSNTGVEKVILSSRAVNNSDFPFPVLIPVPKDGYTSIKVYINDILAEQKVILANSSAQ